MRHRRRRAARVRLLRPRFPVITNEFGLPKISGRRCSTTWSNRVVLRRRRLADESAEAPPSNGPTVQFGLRLQIVLALAGLMALAFGPLFFAVASLTGATVVGARQQSARMLGHAIGAHVADARATGDSAWLRRALETDAHLQDVEAVCLFALDGARTACAGSPEVAARLAASTAGPEGIRVVRGSPGLTFEIDSPIGGGRVVTRLHAEAGAEPGAALVRLVALYTTVFALALLLFAYFALTRLIVRPIEQLARATDRVAGGARTLPVPTAAARELIELGASVQTMTRKLIANEAALLNKVQELTETTTRLTQTQAQLVRSERLASVGRLSAGLAHEIGNPIAALMGLEDLLLEGELGDETRDFVTRMRRETDRIHRVVRDLLDFARPEASARATSDDEAPADVEAVIDDVTALVRPQKPFREIRIHKDLTETLRVALPASRLTQVLLNIVLNAGAAIVESGRDDGRITLKARRANGGSVRIEVEDNGTGISAELRDEVFEPFVTTKSVGEGTGLGLAVCRGLIESAGGEIGLDGSYDLGARFFVVLRESVS
jgi:two-component system NtrC family sensor kinase